MSGSGAHANSRKQDKHARQTSLLNTLLETETFDWEAGRVVANANYSAPSYASQCPAWAWDSQVRNPYVRLRTLNRDGSRYETLISQVDAYGQPTEIVEIGEAQRSSNKKIRQRRLGYDYQPQTNQVSGRVASDQSCLGSGCLATCPSGCATTTRTFVGLNGLPDSEIVKGVATQFSYHPDGSLRSVTDANGKTMTITYSNGQPTAFTFSPSLAVGRTHEWDGQVRSVTSARGFTTFYGHDAAGRMNSITPPTGNDSSTINYDTTGRVVTETRGSGLTSLVTTNTLDALGRSIEKRNNLNERQTAEFDSMGRQIFASISHLIGEPELGVQTQYDGLGRAIKGVQRFVATSHRPLLGSCATPGACETSYVYRPDHCVDTTISRKSGDSVTTTTCFESFGEIGSERIETIIDANAGRWGYRYDIANNLVEFTGAQPSGNRSFELTSLNYFLRKETTAARGTTETTAHTPLGQPKTRVDARRVTATFEYNDPLSRLSSIKYPSFPQENSDRTYDGHLAGTVSSPIGGTYTYQYDSVDRVRIVTWVFQSHSYTTRYDYDSSGCLTRLTYPTGTVIVMTCDRVGRATSAHQETTGGLQTIVSSASYKASGRAASVTYGNGKVVSSTFVNGRLQNISTPGVVELSYVYDGADNVVSAVDGQNPANNANPITYDKLNRLRGATSPSGAFAFDYDASGNRLFAEIPGQSRTTYTYNQSTGRLESSNGPAALAPMILSWSAGERIATSSDGATYVHDALGRRVRKTQPNASLDVVFHYDLAGRLLAETDTNGIRIREYVYLQGQLVATQGCLRGFSVACQDRSWIHSDLVGSVVARTNSASVVTRFENKPWGASLPDEEPRRFNGRWFDRGINSFDFGARMYSPTIGRFLSTDPQWNRANTQHANSYAFVLNSPFNHTDPTGAIPVSAILGASATGVATDFSSLVTPGPFCSANMPLVWKYLQAQETAYLAASKASYVPYSTDLLVENGKGPQFTFGSLPVSFRSSTSIIPKTLAGPYVVGEVTIDESFLRGATVDQVSHAIVHETGHWAWWTALSPTPDPRFQSRYMNIESERAYIGFTPKPNLPTEGYDAELHVFGTVMHPSGAIK